ncbi:hypothetical protein D3C80_374280 [compost metagenome]
MAIGQLELRQQRIQRRDFAGQAMAGGSGFLDHRSILLRVLVHLVDGGVDLLETG